MIVKVNFFGKFMNTILTLWSVFGFLIFLVFHMLFLQDNIFHKNLTNIHENQQFDICEYVFSNCSNQIQQNNILLIIIKIFFNVLLLCIFWLQHILMARIEIKKYVANIFPEFLLIERALYNLSASFIYTFSLNFWQPIELNLFELPQKGKQIYMIISLFGGFMVLKSVFDMRNHSDLMGLQFMKSLWNQKTIEFNKIYNSNQTSDIVIKGFYSWCRNPMQFGTLIHIIFSGTNFTLGRILYIIIMGIFIYIGVYQEEQQLLKRYPDTYKNYMLKIKNRFIPNIFAKVHNDDDVKKKD